MTKRPASLAAALLALGVLSQSGSAEAQSAYPPPRVAWIVGQGYSGYSGYPWAGPPWHWPIPAPRRGCYDFHQDLNGVWRRVEVCE
jgi:hypothetical protein